jgi:cell division protein FtsB
MVWQNTHYLKPHFGGIRPLEHPNNKPQAHHTKTDVDKIKSTIAALNKEMQTLQKEKNTISETIPRYIKLKPQHDTVLIQLTELNSTLDKLVKTKTAVLKQKTVNDAEIERLIAEITVVENEITRLIGNDALANGGRRDTVEGFDTQKCAVTYSDAQETGQTGGVVSDTVKSILANLRANLELYNKIKQQNTVLQNANQEFRAEIATNEEKTVFTEKDLVYRRNLLFLFVVVYILALLFFTYQMVYTDMNTSLKIGFILLFVIYPFTVYSLEQTVYDTLYYVYCILIGKTYVSAITPHHTWFWDFPTQFGGGGALF